MTNQQFMPLFIAVTAGLAMVLLNCSAPELEGPGTQPTPIYELAQGSPASPADDRDSEELGGPIPSKATKSSRCTSPSKTEVVTLKVGQTHRVSSGLEISFEGELHDNSGDHSDLLVSLSFKNGSRSDSWLPSILVKQDAVEILDHCVRIDDHSTTGLKLEVGRPQP